MTLGHEITVAIPTIPPRTKLLRRAVGSVTRQTLPAAGISIAADLTGAGAGATRNRAWRGATTPWVAFLDDDDELLPHHLEALAAHQADTGADMVYSWFEIIGGSDPFPDGHFTDPWDPANPRQTTITFLVRRECLEALGGFFEVGEGAADDGLGNRAGEDYDLVLRLNDRYRISHLAERTWRWHHHDSNTSGLAERWHPDRVGSAA